MYSSNLEYVPGSRRSVDKTAFRCTSAMAEKHYCIILYCIVFHGLLRTALSHSVTAGDAVALFEIFSHLSLSDKSSRCNAT